VRPKVTLQESLHRTPVSPGTSSNHYLEGFSRGMQPWEKGKGDSLNCTILFALPRISFSKERRLPGCILRLRRVRSLFSGRTFLFRTPSLPIAAKLLRQVANEALFPKWTARIGAAAQARLLACLSILQQFAPVCRAFFLVANPGTTHRFRRGIGLIVHGKNRAVQAVPFLSFIRLI
jgi:hypothetical protein